MTTVIELMEHVSAPEPEDIILYWDEISTNVHCDDDHPSDLGWMFSNPLFLVMNVEEALGGPLALCMDETDPNGVLHITSNS